MHAAHMQPVHAHAHSLCMCMRMAVHAHAHSLCMCTVPLAILAWQDNEGAWVASTEGKPMQLVDLRMHIRMHASHMYHILEYVSTERQDRIYRMPTSYHFLMAGVRGAYLLRDFSVYTSHRYIRCIYIP